MGSETLPSASYTRLTNLVYPFTLRVPTNLVYPFTLRVNITRKNAIVKCLDKSYVPFKSNSNREERYSRVPRLRYPLLKGKWRYAGRKARLKCATYRHSKARLNAPPTGGKQIKALWALEWACLY